MTITINKHSFPRFSKRLKKSLEKKGIDLPLNQVQDIAAQSLGKENLYEINTVFNHITEKHNRGICSNHITVSYLKNYEVVIEQASKQLSANIKVVEKDELKNTIIKSLEYLFSANPELICNINKEIEDLLPLEMQLLNPSVQLPAYQNFILCILGAIITNNVDLEKIILKANDTTLDFSTKHSSFGFYTKKSPYFAHEIINNIISGHNSNLTVIVALLTYIKNNKKEESINLSFVTDYSPFIWDLINNFDKNNQSMQVQSVMRQFYKEKELMDRNVDKGYQIN